MKYPRAVVLALVLGVAAFGCSKEDPQSFAKVDHNKDGKIIFEELILVFPDLTVEEFLNADADHNESLDVKEYERLRAARASGKKLDAPAPKPAEPAKPAAPSEPAKAPEPAPSSQTPPAAPAATPAAPAAATPPPAPAPAATPAAPAAAPQTPPPAEAVETVVVESPAPAPAKEAAPARKTYTVARGDSLSRIAKKFGVSAKEIMAANDMKNADHLEAGAEIVIPGASGEAASAPAGAPAAPAPAAVTDFVAGFFAKSEAGDVNGLMDLYGERVDYYKKGKSGKDVVRQDKVDYFQRWPKRTYVPGPARVETLSGGELRVTAPTAFTAAKGDKQVRGQANFTFLLRPAGDGYRIVGEQSLVTEKK